MKEEKEMKYNWVDLYLLEKNAVEKDYKQEWEATRYMVRQKMFVMLCADKEGKKILTVKLDPLYGELLRNTYQDIVPGYYMNKVHWNSVYYDGSVPDEVVKDMLDKGYEAILHSLSKKQQKEIAEK